MGSLGKHRRGHRGPDQIEAADADHNTVSGRSEAFAARFVFSHTYFNRGVRVYIARRDSARQSKAPIRRHKSSSGQLNAPPAVAGSDLALPCPAPAGAIASRFPYLKPELAERRSAAIKRCRGVQVRAVQICPGKVRVT